MAHNCQINVWNELDWELDEDMYRFVMERVVMRHGPQASLIDIYPQQREPQELPEGKTYHSNPPGWIEWICNVKYHGGGALTIGCLQRTIGGEFESHS